MKQSAFSSTSSVKGQCLCGHVCFEIDFPAFWAWHDHTRASRTAHGAVYATYVGTWRKRFRITQGEDEITRYEDKTTGSARSFCRRCGTPLIYERARSRHMINIPRALFTSRTGRQPIPYRHRRVAGLGLHGGAARATQGVPWRCLGAHAQEEAGETRRSVLIMHPTACLPAWAGRDRDGPNSAPAKQRSRPAA